MILKWNYVSLTKINVMINISQTELQSRTHTHTTHLFLGQDWGRANEHFPSLLRITGIV